MSYCNKMADGLLLGFLYETEELCFPNFELPEEFENCNLIDLKAYTDGCSYIELINLNGKHHPYERIVEADGIEKGRWVLNLTLGTQRKPSRKARTRNAGPWL